MHDTLRPGTPDKPKYDLAITQIDNGFRVTSPHIDLSSEADPLLFSITLEKAPVPTANGTIIDNITIDDESSKLQSMFEEARKLRDLPEEQRPRKLLEILRSKVQFAYEDLIKEVSKTDPELAHWVTQNTGEKTTTQTPVSLSEVVDSGYGVCRHLSVAMLALAREAGMEATYAVYNSPSTPNPNPDLAMKNVIRKDNGLPLFRSTPVGEIIWNGHAWVEIRTSKGEWIPVDPSTKLVGDNPTDLQTFKDANYISFSTGSLIVDDLPKDVWPYDWTSLWMHPGEAKRTGVIKINSRPRHKTSRVIPNPAPSTLENEDNEIWPKPTAYTGPLDFMVSSRINLNTLNVKVINVESA